MDDDDSDDGGDLKGKRSTKDPAQRFREEIEEKYEINHLKDKFHGSIKNIGPKKEKMKQEQEEDMIRYFNQNLNKWKKKLEDQKSYKGDQEGDLKERENEMQHNLELITSIAQRIDNENRVLIKKNMELRQEFKAQENERELLVRQLVMQKKENLKYKDEIEEFQEFLAEKNKDEEQIDLDQMGYDDPNKNLPPQSKLM